MKITRDLGKSMSVQQSCPCTAGEKFRMLKILFWCVVVEAAEESESGFLQVEEVLGETFRGQSQSSPLCSWTSIDQAVPIYENKKTPKVEETYSWFMKIRILSFAKTHQNHKRGHQRKIGSGKEAPGKEGALECSLEPDHDSMKIRILNLPEDPSTLQYARFGQRHQRKISTGKEAPGEEVATPRKSERLKSGPKAEYGS